MSDLQNIEQPSWGGVASTPAERNKVMRNTYWLLALSLLPTVLGAWLGVATGITQSLGGGLGLVLFIGGAIGFMFAIEKTKHSSTGVLVLLAFTFFMGLMLSRMIAMVLGFKNGADLIMTAFAGTAGVFAVMRHQARLVRHGQVVVCGRLGSDGGRHRQRVCRLYSRHDGFVSRGHRYLQCLHAVRPEANFGWRRNQLHQCHTDAVHGFVQCVPKPLGFAGHHGRRARLI
ncbi:MAG: Modulator of FtsH protease YccA [Pseudomonadota bacterium]